MQQVHTKGVIKQFNFKFKQNFFNCERMAYYKEGTEI
jgi:hypothetical protein